MPTFYSKGLSVDESEGLFQGFDYQTSDDHDTVLNFELTSDNTLLRGYWEDTRFKEQSTPKYLKKSIALALKAARKKYPPREYQLEAKVAIRYYKVAHEHAGIAGHQDQHNSRLLGQDTLFDMVFIQEIHKTVTGGLLEVSTIDGEIDTPILSYQQGKFSVLHNKLCTHAVTPMQVRTEDKFGERAVLVIGITAFDLEKTKEYT